jgi:hypothetical protein
MAIRRNLRKKKILNTDQEMRLRILEIVANGVPNWRSKWVLKKADEYINYVMTGQHPPEEYDRTEMAKRLYRGQW